MSYEVRIFCRSPASPKLETLRPSDVTLSRDAGPKVEEAVRELLFILDVSRPSAGRDRLREHLQHTRQLFTVVREGAVTLPEKSSVEASIAASLDGVIELPQSHSGRSDLFLDAKLRRVHRL